MIEFFTRIFKRETSGTTAKERLRLVLLSDHLALAPDVVAAMKADLLEVISRYVDIDPAHSDVTFEQQDRTIAMLANVPILGLKARENPGARVAPPPAAPELASVAGGQAGTYAVTAGADAAFAPVSAAQAADVESRGFGDSMAPEPLRNGAGPGVFEAVTALDELRAAEADAPSVSIARPAAERPSGVAATTPMLPLEATAAARDRDAHDAFAAHVASAAADASTAHDASAAHDVSTAQDTAQPVDAAATAELPAGGAAPAAVSAGTSAPKAAGAKPRARRRRRRAAAKPSPAAG